MRPLLPDRWIRVSVGVGFGAALLLVAVLAVENRSLKRSYGDLVDRASRAHPGSYVPTFTASISTGDSVDIGGPPDGARQVLFFLTTTCPFCRASLEGWNQIADFAKTEPRVYVYGIALDSATQLVAFTADHRLQSPVLTMSERKLARLYRVRRVPLTLVIDDEGRVIYAREGAVTAQETIDSVLAAMRAPARPSVDSAAK